MLHHVAVFIVLSILVPAGTSVGEPPRIGIDSNYVLDMAAHHKGWQDGSGAPVDPYQLLARSGCQDARIRLWTGAMA